MSMQTLEAPSVERAVTKEDVLRLIPQFEIKPVFLRHYLKREVVIGTIGDRGGGKSGTDAVLSVVEFMLAGKPVWSNLDIGCDIEIDDDTARKYGLNSGGTVSYRSEKLEKNALLKLDDSYRGGCLVIEEINVQYSNVRRFMSNTNIEFNEVCQQLRKFKTSLLYNVIDEMFIDSQLRALTDIFIKTYDTAFDMDSLEQKKQTGVDFRWKVYPMSGYLAGEQKKYSITKQSLPPITFHFMPWRDIYDTGQHQEKGTYTMSTKDKQKMMQAEVSVESSPEMAEHFDEWGWLYTEVSKLYQTGTGEISQSDLFDCLNINPKDEDEVDKYLKGTMRLQSKWSGGVKYYRFPSRVFERERAKVLGAD